MVFLFDMGICAVSIFFANYLRFYNNEVLTKYTLIGLVVTLSINALFFLIFKTYQGIIRFSGTTEALRTSLAIFATFLLLLFVNVLMIFSSNKTVVPTTVLFIYLTLAVFLLVGYRLLVKYLYRVSINKDKRIHVAIFGGEMNGSQLKSTIEHASNNVYKVVAFLDNDDKYIGKTIDNTKIYNYENLSRLIDELEIKILLFAKQDLTTEEKNKIVDLSLEKSVDVRNIPPMDEWIKGNLNLSQLKEIKIEELLGRPPIRIKNEHVKSLIASKRILITGAAGSIGSEIAHQVAQINPSMLILFDQTETGLYELEYELKDKYPWLTSKLAVYIGDMREEISMENMFKKYQPELVFHAAAYKHVPMMEYHPSEAIRNNVQGTRILANLSIEYGVERFLLISTDKAINPTNVMGASKRIAEIYVQSLGNRERKVVHLKANITNDKDHISTKFITTRFGNVLGSNGSVIPRFKDQISKGGPITVTHPDIIRYFMTIPEACSLVLEAVTMGKGGEIFIFDMGQPVKILDLAKKMIRLGGLIPGRDIEIKITGLRPGEKLYEELLNKEEELVKTHNEKILITKVVEYDFYVVNKNIDDLIETANKNNDWEVVRKMKSIVPEYISQNSQYTSVDERNQNTLIASAN